LSIHQGQININCRPLIRVKIEYDLMEIIPREEWNVFSLQLIYFGRAICKARKPLCPTCPLYDLCEFPDKISKPG